jgi:hypothetical protein
MKNNRLRLKVNGRQRQLLKQSAKLVTITALLTTTFILYNLVISVKKSSAEIKTEITGKLDGFALSMPLEVNTEALGIQSKFLDIPLLGEIMTDDLKYYTKGGLIQDENASDLCFTLSDGITVLPHEIHRYDPEKGKILFWIRLAHLSPNKDNTLIMYAGKAGKTTETREAVFQTPHKSIFHLNNDFTESIHKEAFGETYQVKDEEGKIAACKSFNAHLGSSAKLNVPQLQSYDGSITVSFWLNPSNQTKSLPIMQIGKEGGFAFNINSNNKIGFEIRDKKNRGAEIKSEKSIAVNTWSHVAGVFDASKDSLYIYVNGKPENKIRTGLRYNADGKLLLGGSHGYFFDGLIDEIQISYEACSAEKMQLIFNNQSNPQLLFNINKSQINRPQNGILSFNNATAEPRKGHVLISWESAYENNVDLFKVERSNDGINFSKIAAQFASGSNNESKSYFAIDPQPNSEKSIYRIAGIGFNGEIVYSKTMEVIHIENDNPVAIDAVEPNPFDNKFEVKYKLGRANKGLLSITNIHGQKVHEALLDPEQEKYEFDHGSKLLPGIYFISLKQDNEQHTLRLVKKTK